MEAGIYPASPSVDSEKIIETVLELSEQWIALCTIVRYSQCKTEYRTVKLLMETILSHINIILTQLSVYTGVCTNAGQATHIQPSFTITNLLMLNNSLWQQLAYPHTTKTHANIFSFILAHYKIICKLQPSIDGHCHQPPYRLPSKSALPSVQSQVITNPTTIIDPYLSALHRNYYFPLISTMAEDSIEAMNDGPTNPEASTRQQKSPPRPAKDIVTVENSLEVITDVLAEMEGDEPPVSTPLSQDQPSVQQQAIQDKPTYYKHRFSIYRRSNNTNIPAKPPTQLVLFRSFTKTLQSIDSQVQILPMRNDINIHPLSTTDQLIHIDKIGIPNYFKAYKKTKKTLSGDFHIGTKLTFDELKQHKNLTTWFHHHGYNIALSGCQSSDMVHIGFLSRVRCFTYRDDLYQYIIAQEDWGKQPFHFRLYFDSFSTNVKGLLTYVLMIDVDHPNIEVAMSFFQHLFDGDSLNPPNKIPYLFLPLYRKTYSDTERKSIIEDNDHHTEQTSVVAISGLNNLNTIVQLQQGVHVTIRHLLLAIPAQGTSTGKFFLQIERQ